MSEESNIGHTGSAGAAPVQPTAGGPAKPDYAVGYGRPPKASRFKKGQSGNRSGRKKRKEIDDVRVVIEDVLAEQVKVREGGKTRTISKLEAMMQAHLMNALKGNPKAVLALFKLGQKTGMFSRAKLKPCLVIDPPGTDAQKMILRVFHGEHGAQSDNGLPDPSGPRTEAPHG